jgi:SMODS-associated and fused to various effectors sensor domain
MVMSEPERRKLWVKAGGRCTLCKAYLLEGNLTFKEIFLGEGAHIVGQLTTPGSPRGADSDLPADDRDKAENILLACASCHTEIDKQQVTGLLTVEELKRRKTQHENEVRHQTGLTTDRRTTVLRVQGWVRGAAMELGKDTAAIAVIRSSDRFPLFQPSFDQNGIEIDLRHLPGEEEGSPEYYVAARKKIDLGVRERLYEGIRSNQVHHLSVFAIARLPLLIYLGWALEDGIATDVYQRHRRSGDWLWPKDGQDTNFMVETLRDGTADATDAVLITNLSGTTHLENIPDDLATCPAFQLRVNGDTPHEDIIATPQTVVAFEGTVRRFFSGLEENHKPLQRLHVFGGLPVAAAVTLGRSLKAADLRPSVVLYDLVQDGYRKVMDF